MPNSTQQYNSKIIDENTLSDKSNSQIIVEIIEYVPNSLLTKTIIKKSTGNISVMSFNSVSEFTEKISPFDTYAQVIEGKAELIIDKAASILMAGEGVIIPANTTNFIKPNGGLKMILTIIKNADE